MACAARIPPRLRQVMQPVQWWQAARSEGWMHRGIADDGKRGPVRNTRTMADGGEFRLTQRVANRLSRRHVGVESVDEWQHTAIANRPMGDDDRTRTGLEQRTRQTAQALTAKNLTAERLAGREDDE